MQIITDNAYQRFADELTRLNTSGRTRIPRSRGRRRGGHRRAELFRHAPRPDHPHPPGNVDDDRYFEAWVDQTTAVLERHTVPKKP